MRLFTGISLPETVLYTVDLFLAPLRPSANIRWSPLANLHITTKFIGEWPVERQAELIAVLKTVTSSAFDVTLGGLGWFPNPHTPHVFWMGVDGGTALPQLAAATDAVVAELGGTPETRAFSPHLTLARTRRESNLRPLRKALETSTGPTCPPFTVADFHLYESTAGAYRKLHTFAFVNSSE